MILNGLLFFAFSLIISFIAFLVDAVLVDAFLLTDFVILLVNYILEEHLGKYILICQVFLDLFLFLLYLLLI